ncbi:MAG: glycosyltransferase [Promethearchaeota archaeon]
MIVDTSPVTLWLEKPVFQYVHQYGERSDKNKYLVKRAFRSIYKKFMDYYYIKGLRKSLTVFVVSQPIIEILKHKGVTNLILTPHGVKLDKFQKPLINNFHKGLKDLKAREYFIITYTGWVTENRGFQLMMDSIKKIAQKESKVVLVIAGADKHFSERITEFAKQNHLEGNIINFGVIDMALIPGILHLSDVCLSFLDDVPAYKISPPQKVIEYFAAGKPVICNKIQTHELLVKDGVTGLITRYDARDISTKILRLMKDRELLKTMSQNALEEAKKYDINVIYGQMVELINAQLDEHKN